MNTDRVSCEMTSSVMLNSADIALRAGATMEEDTGEMKVKQDTVTTAAHFFFIGQFLGFSGSSGPSQVTYPVSTRNTAKKSDIPV